MISEILARQRALELFLATRDAIDHRRIGLQPHALGQPVGKDRSNTRPLLWHAIRNALAAKPDRLVVVVAPGSDAVVDAVRSWDLSPKPTFVVQEEPLGTGHAVLAARSAVGRVDEVLVVGGDFDPVAPEDVRKLDSIARVDLTRIHPVNRDEVQRILAKAQAGGVGSLTPDEARFLSNFIST